MKRLRLVALTHSFVDVCYNIQVDQTPAFPNTMCSRRLVRSPNDSNCQ